MTYEMPTRDDLKIWVAVPWRMPKADVIQDIRNARKFGAMRYGFEFVKLTMHPNLMYIIRDRMIEEPVFNTVLVTPITRVSLAIDVANAIEHLEGVKVHLDPTMPMGTVKLSTSGECSDVESAELFVT